MFVDISARKLLNLTVQCKVRLDANCQHHHQHKINGWVLCGWSFKVHIFREGHKILRNLHLTFVLCSASQKWRFCKILWPSQNIWTLNANTYGSLCFQCKIVAFSLFPLVTGWIKKSPTILNLKFQKFLSRALWVFVILRVFLLCVHSTFQGSFTK